MTTYSIYEMTKSTRKERLIDEGLLYNAAARRLATLRRAVSSSDISYYLVEENEAKGDARAADNK